jgi:hypothetical protein
VDAQIGGVLAAGEKGLGALPSVRPVVDAARLVRPLGRRRLVAARVGQGHRAVDGVLRGLLGHHGVLVAHLDRPLEQPRMQVEDVAGVGFATRRPAQQQRQLAVGVGLLREVVVDHQGRATLPIHEVLGHGGAGIGRDVLQRRRVRGAGRDDDGVVHRAGLGEPVDDADDRRLLLADGDVDAGDAGTALVDDGVDGDGGAAGLAVADDQLALAAADRDHAVDRLEAGLQRLVHRLPAGDARRLELERPAVRRLHHALAVERPAQRVDHPADHRLAARHAQQLAGAAHLVTFLDVEVAAEDDDADRALLQVEDLAELAVLELQLLSGHGVGQAVDPRDAVTDLEHPADFGQVDLAAEVADLLGQNRGNLIHP